jgi:hypothetical protein
MCNNARIHHVPDFPLRAFFDNSFWHVQAHPLVD